MNKTILLSGIIRNTLRRTSQLNGTVNLFLHPDACKTSCLVRLWLREYFGLKKRGCTRMMEPVSHKSDTKEKLNETPEKKRKTSEKANETSEKLNETSEKLNETSTKANETSEKSIETSKKANETSEKANETSEKAKGSDNWFTVVSLDGWKERWEEGNIKFHKTTIHHLLQEYKDRLIAGREHIKIFFPLCGKTLDMKWMYDLGHDVIGVEVSAKGIKEFFEESGLEYTVEPLKNVTGNCFKSTDGRVRIFECDLFEFNKDLAGQFDAIWDRGSIVAINREDRERYSVLIKSLMAPDCHYLMCIYKYDENTWPGPPHIVPESQVEDLFGDFCTKERVCCVDSFDKNRHSAWGITYLEESIFLFIPK